MVGQVPRSDLVLRGLSMRVPAPANFNAGERVHDLRPGRCRAEKAAAAVRAWMMLGAQSSRTITANFRRLWSY